MTTDLSPFFRASTPSPHINRPLRLNTPLGIEITLECVIL